MKKIAYQRPNGMITIVIPARKEDIEKLRGPLTDEQYESHVKERSIPSDAINVVDIEDTDIPVSREFRNAWTLSEKVISEDLQKSIDIKLAAIRIERDAELTGTDKEYMKALEMGDQVSLDSLKITRQKLRDATNILKLGTISSVEELRGKKLDDYL